jgi:hypothetical protein
VVGLKDSNVLLIGWFRINYRMLKICVEHFPFSVGESKIVLVLN